MLHEIPAQKIQKMDALKLPLSLVPTDLGTQISPRRGGEVLLNGLTINRPNQVWCSDITYIPIKRGFLYLVAIMDWYSRKVLSWRISNTLDTEFCVQALKEAIFLYGIPEIFNTDQGSQFTSLSFTTILKDHGIKISMDGKGRWMDNVFIERLWRSLKYECVYLDNLENGWQAKVLIGNWISHYNGERPHSTLYVQTIPIGGKLLPIGGKR